MAALHAGAEPRRSVDGQSKMGLFFDAENEDGLVTENVGLIFPMIASHFS